MSFNRFSAMIVRSIRFVVIAFACTLLLISNTLPASAIGAPRTSPDKGSVQLDDIQAKSEEVTKAPPLSGEETQREANKGINEIQGDANKDQMFRPENSRATSVIEQAEEVLENITGGRE